MLAVVLAASLLGSDEPPKEHPGATRDFSASGSGVTLAATAIGGLVGGTIGAAAAIGMGAGLASTSRDASLLPLIALPPLFVAAGAGVGAWCTGGTNAAWGGAGAALLGSGATTLAIALVVLDAPDARIGRSFDATFLLEAAAAPVVGAAAGALTAALLTE